MLTLGDIRNDHKLQNEINWDMTPEEAVTLYLEWGNNWAHGNYVIRSKDDYSTYFVVNTWGHRPVIYLMRRNSEDVVELAGIELPEKIEKSFLESIGYNKGVYALTQEIKMWLKKELFDFR